MEIQNSDGVGILGQAWSKKNTLTDGATINTDCSDGNVHEVTLEGNRTLANPTNLEAGSTYIWIIKQDATGSRTLDFGTAFKFPYGVEPTLTTDGDAVDIISGISDGTDLYCSTQFDFS